jgi:hypothetical protein
MVEGLHDDPARELPKHPQSALRRTWQTLEHYLTRRLAGPGRPSSLSA